MPVLYGFLVPPKSVHDLQRDHVAQKVELLLRLIPIVVEEGVFAIHGGTAINLFLKDLPRYSVDIDLTYIPLSDRQQSIKDINRLSSTDW